MDTQQNMESRLWEFIDGRSSHEEKTVIEQLLESDRRWKEKYNELLEIHQLMRSSELEEPSMRFTKNVMEQIAKFQIAPATKTYINKKIIWSIGAFFILLVTAFLIYAFGQVDWNVRGDSNLPVDLGKIDYSKIFSNTYVNIFMMINVVLGLFLLDNYFSQKRKKFRKEAW
jgi:hypothetical protein